jgi:hypothetical protein
MVLRVHRLTEKATDCKVCDLVKKPVGKRQLRGQFALTAIYQGSDKCLYSTDTLAQLTMPRHCPKRGWLEEENYTTYFLFYSKLQE